MDLYESGRWSFLLNVVDHLPRTSYYAHAVAQDDDLADEAPEPTGRYEIPLTEWSPEREALAAMLDRLGEVAQAIYATAGGKPGRLQPSARPVTAFDRARARKRKQADADLERKLFPHLHEEA